MRLITKREICLSVPDRWAEQYEGHEDDSKAHTRAALLALSVNQLTPEIIAKTIGNSSWTRLECRECEVDVDRAVEIAGRILCHKCLNRAETLSL